MSIKDIHQLLTNIHDKNVAILTTGLGVNQINYSRYYKTNIDKQAVSDTSFLNYYMQTSTSYKYHVKVEGYGAGSFDILLNTTPTLAAAGTGTDYPSVCIDQTTNGTTSSTVLNSTIFFTDAGTLIYQTRVLSSGSQYGNECLTIRCQNYWTLAGGQFYLFRYRNRSGATNPGGLKLEWWEEAV